MTGQTDRASVRPRWAQIRGPGAGACVLSCASWHGRAAARTGWPRAWGSFAVTARAARSCTFTCRLAHNDPPGPWTVRVVDVATGTAGQTVVNHAGAKPH